MLHEVHCQRNFYRCECGEFLKKAEKAEHEEAAHKTETCPHCRLSAPAYQMAKHKCEKLPKTCQFCNAVIIFDEYVEHVKVCGSRTQLCPVCKKYIQAWTYERHEATCVPEPEPVRAPAPPKYNRFIEQERQAKEKVQAQKRQEDTHVSPVRSAVERPKPTKPVAESGRSNVKLTQPVSGYKPAAKTGGKPGPAVGTKPAVTGTKPSKPGSMHPASDPKGPRTYDRKPIPSRQPAEVKEIPADDYDFEYVEQMGDYVGGQPRYVGHDEDLGHGYAPAPVRKPDQEVIDEDEALARAYEESLRDAPSSIPRQGPKQPEFEDDDFARAYAASMEESPPHPNPRHVPARDEGSARVPAGVRPPQFQPPSDSMDSISRADSELARALQESMQGNQDWMMDEDPALHEAILKSMREK